MEFARVGVVGAGTMGNGIAHVAAQAGLELRDKLGALPEMAEVTFSMEDQKPEVRVAYDRRKMAELEARRVEWEGELDQLSSGGGSPIPPVRWCDSPRGCSG